MAGRAEPGPRLQFRVFVSVGVGLVIAMSRLTYAENLLQAYRQGIAASPVIAEARAQLRADRAGRPLARAALLPHLILGASDGANDATITGFLLPISGPYRSDSYSVTLNQPLFNGAAYAVLHAADSRIRSGQAALAYAQQTLVLQITEAYFGVLRAQADARVARRQEQLLESLYLETQTDLKVGTGDRVSVVEARARLDAARSARITTSDAGQVARRQLERLTQAPIGVLSDVGPFPPRGPNPDRVHPWVAMALRNQPLLQEARAQLRTAQDQVDVNRRAAWPTISLSGIAQHSLGSLLPGMKIDQVGASINLSLPLYEGGGIDASVQQARAKAQVRRAQLTDLYEATRLDTETAFLALQDSVAQLEAARATQSSTRVSFAATHRGYEVGTRSVVDVLTAATDAAQAQRDYYRALYTQIVARVRLKAAVGILTPDDLIAINVLLRRNPIDESIRY